MVYTLAFKDKHPTWLLPFGRELSPDQSGEVPDQAWDSY